MAGTRRFTVTLGAVVAGLAMMAAPARAACPNGVQTRQEVRTLSGAQLANFVNALKALQAPGANGGPSRYDTLVAFHLQNATSVHNYADFLPWHRQFLLDLEHALQTINPKVTIPYWDASLDAQAPQLAPVFAANEFGGNGVAPTQIVANGPFANWKPFYPTRHGLTRQFNAGPGINPWYDPSVINAMLAGSTTFNTVQQQLQFGQHGLVHNGVGGDMAAMDSPNDPLFWMLHAYIDKLWSDWQKLSPANATSYGGTNLNGSAAKPTDLLPGYPTLHVSNVLSISSLCYAYQTPAAVAPPAPSLRGADQITGQGPGDLIPTTVSITSSRSVLTDGQPVTFTASVDASEGAGSVRFAADDAGIAGCLDVPLRFTGQTWQAACTTSTLRLGQAPRRITAKFLGVGSFAPSEAQVDGGVRVMTSVPEIEFATPPTAHYGDRIGASVLHATASVPGKFVYTVAPIGNPADVQPATATLVLPAGEYDLRATFEPADGSPPQTMTVPYVIDQAALTIQPEARHMIHGQLRPPLTWIASGFVNGDSPTVLLQQPVCLIADRSVAVGQHKILCEGGTATNYTITYPKTEMLTVAPRPCVAGWSCASEPPPAGGDDIRPTGLMLVCQPPIEASRVSFVGVLPTGQDGVRRTIWRGRTL
jgi:hypothetical protein